MNITTLGGLFMIGGAYGLYTGNMIISVLFYFFADLCWFWVALQNADIWGLVTIFTGILAGLAAAYKMKTGIFRTSIRKGE